VNGRTVVFKRLETDREFRRRLLAHPKVTGLYYSQASTAYGATLDAIGDCVECQRRIVEESRP